MVAAPNQAEVVCRKAFSWLQTAWRPLIAQEERAAEPDWVERGTTREERLGAFGTPAKAL